MTTSGYTQPVDSLLWDPKDGDLLFLLSGLEVQLVDFSFEAPVERPKTTDLNIKNKKHI